MGKCVKKYLYNVYIMADTETVAIAEGGFGCAVKPPVKCEQNEYGNPLIYGDTTDVENKVKANNSIYERKIAKVVDTTENTNINSEINGHKLFEEADPDHKFHLAMPIRCNVTPKNLSEEQIKEIKNEEIKTLKNNLIEKYKKKLTDESIEKKLTDESIENYFNKNVSSSINAENFNTIINDKVTKINSKNAIITSNNIGIISSKCKKIKEKIKNKTKEKINYDQLIMENGGIDLFDFGNYIDNIKLTDENIKNKIDIMVYFWLKSINIIEGLEKLCVKNVSHQDIKPENILYDIKPENILNDIEPEPKLYDLNEKQLNIIDFGFTCNIEDVSETNNPFYTWPVERNFYVRKEINNFAEICNFSTKQFKIMVIQINFFLGKNVLEDLKYILKNNNLYVYFLQDFETNFYRKIPVNEDYDPHDEPPNIEQFSGSGDIPEETIKIMYNNIQKITTVTFDSYGIGVSFLRILGQMKTFFPENNYFNTVFADRMGKLLFKMMHPNLTERLMPLQIFDEYEKIISDLEDNRKDVYANLTTESENLPRNETPTMPSGSIGSTGGMTQKKQPKGKKYKKKTQTNKKGKNSGKNTNKKHWAVFTEIFSIT